MNIRVAKGLSMFKVCVLLLCPLFLYSILLYYKCILKMLKKLDKKSSFADIL